jgi:hypothetical protein
MDVRFDAATETFRHEVRSGLEANVPTTPMPTDSDADNAHMCTWQRRMFDAGWAGIH